jgi:hypothetical protein
LKDAFDQLGVINSSRNHLIHYGTNFEVEPFMVSNALVAHLPERLRKLEMSAATLDQMISDISKIILHVVLCTISLEKPELSALLRRHLSPILQRSWLYKPT